MFNCNRCLFVQQAAGMANHADPCRPQPYRGVSPGSPNSIVPRRHALHLFPSETNQPSRLYVSILVHWH